MNKEVMWEIKINLLSALKQLFEQSKKFNKARVIRSLLWELKAEGIEGKATENQEVV